ncbi:hypothetical protein, partial [Alteromonas australica]
VSAKASRRAGLEKPRASGVFCYQQVHTLLSIIQRSVYAQIGVNFKFVFLSNNPRQNCPE